jgi:hypothetical protein
MKSVARGPSISPVEVTNVSTHGFWLFIGERELFVAFRDFPWFKEASIGAITQVELPSPHHLYWPELDVDLAVESIEHPGDLALLAAERGSLYGTRPRHAPLFPGNPTGGRHHW